MILKTAVEFLLVGLKPDQHHHNGERNLKINFSLFNGLLFKSGGQLLFLGSAQTGQISCALNQIAERELSPI